MHPTRTDTHWDPNRVCPCSPAASGIAWPVVAVASPAPPAGQGRARGSPGLNDTGGARCCALIMPKVKSHQI